MWDCDYNLKCSSRLLSEVNPQTWIIRLLSTSLSREDPNRFIYQLTSLKPRKCQCFLCVPQLCQFTTHSFHTIEQPSVVLLVRPIEEIHAWTSCLRDALFLFLSPLSNFVRITFVRYWRNPYGEHFSTRNQTTCRSFSHLRWSSLTTPPLSGYEFVPTTWKLHLLCSQLPNERKPTPWGPRRSRTPKNSDAFSKQSCRFHGA